MFPLHDQTRRRVCRTAFFLLCVMPTAVVAGWAVVWHTPWSRQSEQTRLAQETGLDVTLTAVRHLQPGVVLYAGVTLADPETGAKLLSVPSLKATWTWMLDRHGQRRTAIKLEAKEAEIETTCWNRLYQLVEQKIRCKAGRPEAELRLAIERVKLHAADGTQTVSSVVGELGVPVSDVEVRVAFRPEGDKSLAPVKMRVVRNQMISPPENSFEIDTQGAAMPCRLVAVAFRDAVALGPDCRFTGYFYLRQAAGGWDGGINRGMLLDLDLDRLVSHYFPHKLTGRANLTIPFAEFKEGRLTSVNGLLAAGPGTIGRDLIDAAAVKLRFDRTARGEGNTKIVPYDRLALAFAIDEHGLGVEGQCPNAPGAVLMAAGERVLSQPQQTQPLAALIHALVPGSDVDPLAAPQSGWLAAHLPLAAGVAGPQARNRSESVQK